MKKKMDIRSFDVSTLGEGESPTQIVGYAAVFNQVAHGEVIRPGAFKKTLTEQKDIKAYWSHDSAGSAVLGRTSNGTLELSEDETGLHVVITPNLQTEWGRSALASVHRGDVDQMSFGFAPIQESMETLDGETIRVLKEVKLYEVSPVAEPWYSGTSASARNAEAQADQPEPGESYSTEAAAREALIREMEIHNFGRTGREV